MHSLQTLLSKIFASMYDVIFGVLYECTVGWASFHRTVQLALNRAILPPVCSILMNFCRNSRIRLENGKDCGDMKNSLPNVAFISCRPKDPTCNIYYICDKI